MRDVQSIAHEVREALAGDVLDCEVRFSPLGDDGSVEGLAVAFDVTDTYKTSFDRRAFQWDGKPIPMLWAHRADAVVGSVRSVVAEAAGLRIKAKLNMDVQRAREVRSMLIAGDISGLSIGFRRLRDEPRPNGVRHITQAELREVSFVPFASVPGASVTSVRMHRQSDALSAFTAALRRTSATLGTRNPKS